MDPHGYIVTKYYSYYFILLSRLYLLFLLSFLLLFSPVLLTKLLFLLVTYCPVAERRYYLI